MPKSTQASAPPTDMPSRQETPAVSVEQIARHLADAIVAKRLPPGTWLREEALGRAYSVSRTKVRAALMALSKDKIVEMVPDKGAFVSRPGVQEAREVFAMRRLLEAEVVRLICQQATTEHLEALTKHIQAEHDQLHKQVRTSSAHERVLGDFHVVLAQMTGNKTLADMVSELVPRSSLIAMLYHSHNNPECSSEEHAQLVDALRSGPVELAVKLMTEHLLRIEENLELKDVRPAPQADLLLSLLMN
jgi:DNA-binding GntR family transcriptional regulator